jgi:hypothetical protein
MKYVYLVMNYDTILSAHDRKYMAHEWVKNSGFQPEEVRLYRMSTGLNKFTIGKDGYKTLPSDLVPLDWEF